jgi:hypothetical protein
MPKDIFWNTFLRKLIPSNLNVKIGVNYAKKLLIILQKTFYRIGFCSWPLIKILISTLIRIKNKVIQMEHTKKII